MEPVKGINDTFLLNENKNKQLTETQEQHVRKIKIPMSQDNDSPKAQCKHYRKRHVKVKRSKLQGCKSKTDRKTMLGGTSFASDSPSTEEEMTKMKEIVKNKGRSNRKLILLDWDRTPFVFSVRSASSSGDSNRIPKMTRYKSICTIEEEDERDLVIAASSAIGRIYTSNT